MIIDDILQISLLYDIYGSLLSGRQKETLELYYGENLSLSEIASELEISRQSVHESIKNGEKMLRYYEDILQIATKAERNADIVNGAQEELEQLKRLFNDDVEIVNKLDSVINKLNKIN
ncbi:MAG: sigma factor-like helix-turn-helix DNA-binding protein [Eubacteriales bacterium]|nr:sigma factor-like helix-turn-helix DNA-binding protein [Eubacteriales bacterium]MDY3333127.1 sigma factor-like helix-turn-helix DNA-binding protein [Gallibacter sp.]